VENRRGKAVTAPGGRISACGLVPICRFERLEQALGVAEAVHTGGCDVLEFPMTSPLALKAIEKVADAWGDRMFIGAGTVLDPETARSCMLAGAKFIVSPAVSESVIRICKRYSITVCPGGLTPTEILTAWEAGADFVKVFPCGSVGGPEYLKYLKAPFPRIRLIPVGGVTFENAADFIAAGSAALGTGNGLIDPKAVAQGRYDIVTKNTARFVEILKSARPA
jgi:2-dehydro-3-deoxyphosphogluconate aldolase/(4S)-4-hydroxy-2-oxoglutarate aldolase